MQLVTGFKDFFSGLGAGLGLFMTQRNDMVERVVTPGLSKSRDR